MTLYDQVNFLQNEPNASFEEQVGTGDSSERSDADLMSNLPNNCPILPQEFRYKPQHNHAIQSSKLGNDIFFKFSVMSNQYLLAVSLISTGFTGAADRHWARKIAEIRTCVHARPWFLGTNSHSNKHLLIPSHPSSAIVGPTVANWRRPVIASCTMDLT